MMVQQQMALKQRLAGAPFRVARRSRAMQPFWRWRNLRSMVDHWEQSPLLFVHINKTGGTSVSAALGAPLTMHPTATEMKAYVGHEAWEDKLSFAIVRNPFDRIVSQWCYRVKTNQNQLGEGKADFATWVHSVFEQNDAKYRDKPRFFMPQIDWIQDNGSVIVDEVARFECMEHDLQLIAGQVGMLLELPHLNSTDRRSYREYFDSATRRTIEQAFRTDLEYFGYEY
jgi:hypothetical protein